ncbi:unnamed protein product [Symbiodinium sp. KB8]|nr:unnamed protein product [Symbiodinium sp. KB8]
MSLCDAHLQAKMVDQRPGVNWDEELESVLRQCKDEGDFMPFEMHEIVEELGHMKTRSAVGPDKIGVHLLREIAAHETLGKELLDMINQIVRRQEIGREVLPELVADEVSKEPIDSETKKFGLGQLLEVILIDKGGGREGRVDLSDEQGMISSDGKATMVCSRALPVMRTGLLENEMGRLCKRIKIIDRCLGRIGLQLSTTKTKIVANAHYRGPRKVKIRDDTFQVAPQGDCLRALGLNFSLSEDPSDLSPTSALIPWKVTPGMLEGGLRRDRVDTKLHALVQEEVKIGTAAPDLQLSVVTDRPFRHFVGVNSTKQRLVDVIRHLSVTMQRSEHDPAKPANTDNGPNPPAGGNAVDEGVETIQGDSNPHPSPMVTGAMHQPLELIPREFIPAFFAS